MTTSKDLRYRGPLSYRGLRVIALLAMTVATFSGIILSFAKIMSVLMPDNAVFRSSPGLLAYLPALGEITFPLLIIASMSLVIRDSHKIYRVMISYFLLAVLTYFFVIGLAEKLIASIIEITPDMLKSLPDIEELEKQLLTILLDKLPEGSGLTGLLSGIGLDAGTAPLLLTSFMEEETGMAEIAGTLSEISTSDLAEIILQLLPEIISDLGIDMREIMPMISEYVVTNLVRSHLNINVFQDLFLATVFYYFTAYTPRKISGGKLVLFRTCAIFPALLLMGGTVLSGMNRANMIHLPLGIVCILTSRKPAGILLIFSMVLFIKYHEAEYAERHRGIRDGFSEYLKTNRNSLHFSLFISIVLALLSLLDWRLGFIPGMNSWGIGSSSTMFAAIPFILLFSYNRQTRFRFLDAFVPIYYILHYILLFIFLMALLAAAPQILAGTIVI